eukprot:m.212093 g.212093  ORF g.212093 m.212093 type:complete len:589 (-) comp10140_c0_seq39:560-2326(-)
MASVPPSAPRACSMDLRKSGHGSSHMRTVMASCANAETFSIVINACSISAKVLDELSVLLASTPSIRCVRIEFEAAPRNPAHLAWLPAAFAKVPPARDLRIVATVQIGMVIAIRVLLEQVFTLPCMRAAVLKTQHSFRRKLPDDTATWYDTLLAPAILAPFFRTMRLEELTLSAESEHESSYRGNPLDFSVIACVLPCLPMLTMLRYISITAYRCGRVQPLEDTALTTLLKSNTIEAIKVDCGIASCLLQPALTAAVSCRTAPLREICLLGYKGVVTAAVFTGIKSLGTIETLRIQGPVEEAAVVALFELLPSSRLRKFDIFCSATTPPSDDFMSRIAAALLAAPDILEFLQLIPNLEDPTGMTSLVEVLVQKRALQQLHLGYSWDSMERATSRAVADIVCAAIRARRACVPIDLAVLRHLDCDRIIIELARLPPSAPLLPCVAESTSSRRYYAYYPASWNGGPASTFQVLADPGCRDPIGRTPLHVAMARRAACVVEELLARGADPNARDKAGNTPLHAAFLSEYTSYETDPERLERVRALLAAASHPTKRQDAHAVSQGGRGHDAAAEPRDHLPTSPHLQPPALAK